jgi:hypothetical protein
MAFLVRKRGFDVSVATKNCAAAVDDHAPAACNPRAVNGRKIARAHAIFVRYSGTCACARACVRSFMQGTEIHRYSRAQLMHKLRIVAKAEAASSGVPLCSPFLLVAGVGVLWDIHYRR